MSHPIVNHPVQVIVPPGLQLQLPLDIPDFLRRAKIRPRPVRWALYFGGELAQPATVRPAKFDGTRTAF